MGVPRGPRPRFSYTEFPQGPRSIRSPWRHSGPFPMLSPGLPPPHKEPGAGERRDRRGPAGPIDLQLRHEDMLSRSQVLGVPSQFFMEAAIIQGKTIFRNKVTAVNVDGAVTRSSISGCT